MKIEKEGNVPLFLQLFNTPHLFPTFLKPPCLEVCSLAVRPVPSTDVDLDQFQLGVIVCSVKLMSCTMELLRLYISPGHNFFGHHGGPAGAHPVRELPEIHCLAGRGIEGDRFLDHKENYKGQITFFADEVYQALCQELQIFDKPPSVFRRNVVTRGCDLEELIGIEFEVQGVRFEGVESCKPCYWMDQAFGSGAEQAMQGRGGLRARILTSGVLRVPVPSAGLGLRAAVLAATE